MSKKTVKICNGKSCKAFGASRIMSEVKKELDLKRSKKSDKIDLDFCPCVGFCSSAPNVIVDQELLRNTDTAEVLKEIENPSFEKEQEKKILEIKDKFLGDI